ncbi:MAG: glycoside hydrolase family 3 N-terminal domain-containing protein [Enterococcus sp.]
MTNYPYQNPELTIHERTVDLLSRLSVQEKVGQVNQHLYGWECYTYQNEQISLSDKFKEHVAWGQGVGALYGLFRADPWSQVDYTNGVDPTDSWKVSNAIQEYVIQQSRWGIPALLVEECPHGHQGLGGVSYPTNLGRGNTFNTELVKKTSNLMAKELSYKGVHLALVSTLDLVKDPRWGRSEECFGEDPILAAKMSEAVVAGFQQDLISDTRFVDKTVQEINKKPEQIGVVLKHCVAQGEALGGHNSGTVTLGDREFQDIYQPLLRGVKNAAGVMAAYNDIDGVPCHTNQELLEELLRSKIGYQGIVMADGIALDRLEDVYGSKAQSAQAALTAGVDLSLWDETYLSIGEGIASRKIDEASLDKAVYRVLSLKFLLGLFEHPYLEDQTANFEKLMNEAQLLNLEIAKESLTLVKNNGILPLENKKQKIAVIGPTGEDIYHLLGDYTAPQTKEMSQKTLYNEIKAEFYKSEVSYAQGCEIRNNKAQELLLEEAIVLAQNSDIIILTLGGSSARNFDMEFLRNGAVSSKGINMDSGENVDVASLSLGGRQLELVRRIKELNKPIVSVLVQGRPYDISLVEEVSDAVLLAWFPGQQGGKAVGSTLIGENNPSGRLSLSYPINSGQLPVYYYQRAATKQDHYYDESGNPLHEFGFGLSYSQFSYSDLKVKKTDVGHRVTVSIKNTSSVVGKETCLLFVRLHGGHVIQRKKLLKKFTKTILKPDETKQLSFDLEKNDFLFTDNNRKQRTADSVDIMITDLKTTITCE